MLGIIALSLLLCMMGAEIVLIKEVPWLRRLVLRSKLAALALSAGLSFLLGIIYPAAGMFMFLASVGSTLLMQPIYFGIRLWMRWKVTIMGYVKKVTDIIDTVHSAVVKVANFLAIPRRVIRWIIHPHFNFGGTNPRK